MRSFARLDEEKAELLELLERRGIEDQAVLAAMAEVPREEFVGEELADFAYDDTPLPIEEGQTISQPYIVALMTEALHLHPDYKVLEIGTGSGYSAAVLSRIVKQVYSVERHKGLIDIARQRLRKLGYDNVSVLCDDGTLGWPENAPFDAIVVTAGGPDVPPTLVEQLAIGGSLVIPTGTSRHLQKLLRVTRAGKDTITSEELGAVRFVPLIGKEGWDDECILARKVVKDPKVAKTKDAPELKAAASKTRAEALVKLIANEAQPLESIKSGNLDALMERIGDARLVLLGEASHGTAEFYDMRSRISQELILKKGFRFLAVEADWPDAAQIDHYVCDTRTEPTDETTFSRFPTWMWANRQVLEFVQWLRKHNRSLASEQCVDFYGLDLYSLHSSVNAVIAYLEKVDPAAAELARHRYGCLRPWENDPARYGRLALSDKENSCEREVLAMLQSLLQNRLQYSVNDGRKFLDAVANARLVKDAEKYYRLMYHGSVSSWNLRDQHMFDTLQHLLHFHGPHSKAIVWAHNSHLGNANATAASLRGEHNVGSLCREKFGDAAYLVGFGTHKGQVMAAEDWGAPMQVMNINPSHVDSYEHLCHKSGVKKFLLPLRQASQDLREKLKQPRLERAIGVIYRPQAELESHYFPASLPNQFDEYIWFDRTSAVDALGPDAGKGAPETFPFGL